MKITGKPGRANKYHIFLDGEYTDTTTVDFFATCGIKNGSEISEEKWIELRSAIYLSKIKNKALDLLTLRDHSKKELSDKLYQKFSKDTTDYNYLKVQIESVCSTLEEQGLLNDERFAKVYAESLVRRKSASASAIRGALSQKGISKDIINNVIDSLELNPVESIIHILETKYKGKDLTDEYQRNKIIGALTRLGFNYSEIRAAIYKYTEK
ncbi:MAG: regulatory protein RecX [Oscillospiraceae bacterium]|nr:regulatory protein RecX [Oscillospiraceae bacterium]